MEILVNGTASRYFRPEQVVSAITFKAAESKYEKTLEKGTEAVNRFVTAVIIELGEKKEALKTSGYRVQEKYKLNGNKRVFDGYEFTQSAKIKYKYDAEKMGLFIKLTAGLKDPPSYVIGFEVDDEDVYRNQVLEEAVKKAKAKAETISTAAGLSLSRCIKIDYKPFSGSSVSSSHIGSRDFLMESAFSDTIDPLPQITASRAFLSVSDTIQNTFTPEDICITETLYTLWLAE